MKIVGITGKAGAGKDTVADFLCMYHEFQKQSFAAPLKAALASMGFREPALRDDKEKTVPGFDFTWREAAQTLGTEWGRALDPDIWVKIAALRTRRSDDHVVFADVRFENEAAMIRKIGGIVLHITGRSANLGDAATHASEAGVVFVPGQDAYIDNSGDFKGTKKQVLQALGIDR